MALSRAVGVAVLCALGAGAQQPQTVVPPRGLVIADHVAPPDGIAGASREAAVVVHLQITESLGARWRNREVPLVTEHRARVLAVVKADRAGIAPGREITFDQDAAGEWTEKGFRSVGIETPYRPGESFVAFLRRNADSTLGEFRGPLFMWPAKQGFVVVPDSAGALPPGLRPHMPIEECLTALRKLLEARTREP